MKKASSILLLALSITACTHTVKSDAVYYNGSVITMETDQPQAEALAVKDGRIVFVGNWDEAQNYIGKNTKQIDLKQKALLPGFIDVHGHITSSAGMMQAVDLAPSPYGKVNSITDLQKVLKQHLDKSSNSLQTPILGNGYDDAIMIEHRHPTRSELDAVSTTTPIMVIHASGHASVANSAMLKLLDIDEQVQDPEGGHYGRDQKTNKLNGKLEENACFMALMKLTSFLPKPTNTDGISQELADFVKAQDQWLSYGQTTICDGRTMGVGLDLLKEAASKGLLKADVLRIINSRDYKDAFINCDAPYFNSDCRHYDGYSKEDFENLLISLSSIKGKFLISSYPSEILSAYTKEKSWFTKCIEQKISVANGTGRPAKRKIKVLTANYDLSNPNESLTLFG